jgi:hypothetical protein
VAVPSPAAQAWIAIVLGLLPGACGEAGPERVALGGGRTEDERGLVLGLGADDSVRFVRRIDGSIAEHRQGPVTDDRDQVLLITTKESGRDQCKIMVLDDEGEIEAEYRVSGVSPFPVPSELARHEGETFRQLQAPIANMVIPFTWRQRRLIALCTRNNYAPGSLVLLEAPSPDRLEERLVFWTPTSRPCFTWMTCSAATGRGIS